MFELFRGLVMRTFYQRIFTASPGEDLSEVLAKAIREAVREEDGYQYLVLRSEDGGLKVHIEGPDIRQTLAIPSGHIPQAWTWKEAGEEDVYCSLCAFWIPFRPVPCLLGSHALCERCFRSVLGVPVEDAAEWGGIEIRRLE